MHVDDGDVGLTQARSELTEFGGIPAVVTEVVEGERHFIVVSDVETFSVLARWSGTDLERAAETFAAFVRGNPQFGSTE